MVLYSSMHIILRFDIKGYPTVKFWHNSKDPVDYDGGRDAESMLFSFKRPHCRSYKIT